MDKLRLTGHIKDVDLKNKMFKVIDKANVCIKKHEILQTDFLNPYEIKNAISILNSNSDMKYKIDGGYEESERSVICIYPYYIEDIETDISFLKIEGNFKFKSVSHKDYLGSILGLGIKREKIGDIIIHDNFCQVVVSSDICNFVLFNLEKVSKNNVLVSKIQREDLIKSDLSYKEVSSTISSDRLDCIISSIYNLSRQESSKLIENEKVYVDYEKITQSSKVINNNSMISVKGKGRFIITELGDITKKGKLKIKAKIIL